MSREKVLVVEDEEDILELIRYNLAKEGYVVTGVTTGEDALNVARNAAPDLVLLDIMLPGLDGLEVCRRLKADGRVQHIPVIMLTAKGEESDIVVGLELGATDYVTKPFSPRVLVARIRAVLRRRAVASGDEDALLVRGPLTLDSARYEVRVEDQVADLTATEFKVLHFLARRPGWVFTRQQIVDAVKGEDYPVTERSVDVQMVGLRKKLGSGSELIETVRGIGYRFRDDS